MAVVTVHQAKTQLSKLIARAEAVKLTPIGKYVAKRRFGAMKGKLSLPDSFFFDPLPADELKLWEGGDDEDSAR
jgi:hypothetical protein